MFNVIRYEARIAKIYNNHFKEKLEMVREEVPMVKDRDSVEK